MNKKVSIIIPVYNVGKYLQECLESVLNQTYENIEVLLVNDGSTDESTDICQYFSEKDERIIYIYQENQGAANAKNAGLDRISGAYFTFVDSDDYVEKNWINTMLHTMESTNADVVECNFDKVYVNKTEAGNDSSYYAREFHVQAYMEQYLDNWTCSLFWNKLFKSELTTDIKFRKERRCIDDEFYTYKVVSRGNKIVRIEDCLYHYRQRRSSVVSSEKNALQKTDDALEVLIERYEWIKRYFPELRNKYLNHDINILGYFANDFVFNIESINKLHYTAQYYMKESFKCWPGIRSIKNNVILLCKNEKQLLKNTKNKQGNNVGNLFE